MGGGRGRQQQQPQGQRLRMQSTSSATETEPNTDDDDEEFARSASGGVSSDVYGRSGGSFLSQRHRRSRRSGGLPPVREEAAEPAVPAAAGGAGALPGRWRTFKVRFLWTVILVSGFTVILCAGHFYAGMLVLLISACLYGEVIALKRNAQKDKKIPLFFFLRWYFFWLTIYATLYQWLLPVCDGLGLPRHRLLEIAVSYHWIISYLGAFLGIALFISSLRKFSLRYQFSQFGILILTCLLVVGQSVFQVATIYDGLLWFILSSSTVIVNDCSAYVFGSLFGRRRLFKLSPKKTVEGFLGASVVTLVWAVALCALLARSPVLTCTQTTVDFRPFAMWYADAATGARDACVPAVFHYRTYGVPQQLARLARPLLGASGGRLRLRPAYLHALVIGLFGAFFAPFGGFFASALKRALRIKDFGSSIPGHGGITDRFDCQILMGSFTFFYLRTFVLRKAAARPTLAHVVKLARLLSPADRRIVASLLADGAAAAGVGATAANAGVAAAAGAAAG